MPSDSFLDYYILIQCCWELKLCQCCLFPLLFIQFLIIDNSFPMLFNNLPYLYDSYLYTIMPLNIFPVYFFLISCLIIVLEHLPLNQNSILKNISKLIITLFRPLNIPSFRESKFRCLKKLQMFLLLLFVIFFN